MKSEELITKLKNNEIPDGTKIKVKGYTGNLIISNYGNLRLEKEYWESLEGTKHPLNLYCVVDMLTNPNAEFEIVEECNQVSKLKLIDVLNMIAKGELKEGTKINLEGNYWDLFCPNTADTLFPEILEHLNKEVEIIKPECKHEWKDIETHRMGEGIIRRFRRCVKCGLEEVEERNVGADKTIEPTKIEELDVKAENREGTGFVFDLPEMIIADKLNEVINKVNSQTEVILAQRKDIDEIKEQLDY